jgi:lysophospholipase L1-like esterase
MLATVSANLIPRIRDARAREPHRLLAVALVTLAVLAMCAQVAGATSSATGSRSYVALGDSYSSGEGTSPTTGSCQRGPRAYAPLVATALRLDLTFVACSGAKTRDVMSDQLRALSRSTAYVTISVGGDDADFVGVLARCILHYNCDHQIAVEEKVIREQLPARLDRLYEQIRADAPSARVIVVGYPYLFGTNCTPKDTGMRRLIPPTDLLDATIAQAAARHGFQFIDPRAAFRYHSECDEDPWLNHLLTHEMTKSFHPNAAGYEAYARLVRAVLAPPPPPTGCARPGAKPQCK